MNSEQRTQYTKRKFNYRFLKHRLLALTHTPAETKPKPNGDFIPHVTNTCGHLFIGRWFGYHWPPPSLSLSTFDSREHLSACACSRQTYFFSRTAICALYLDFVVVIRSFVASSSSFLRETHARNLHTQPTSTHSQLTRASPFLGIYSFISFRFVLVPPNSQLVFAYSFRSLICVVVAAMSHSIVVCSTVTHVCSKLILMGAPATLLLLCFVVLFYSFIYFCFDFVTVWTIAPDAGQPAISKFMHAASLTLCHTVIIC